MTRKKTPPPPGPARDAQAWRLRTVEHLGRDEIRERLGFTDLAELQEAQERHGRKVAVTIGAVDLDGEARAELALALHKHNTQQGWWPIGMACGWDGPDAGHEAMLAAHRAGPTLITESQLLALPPGKWRNRGRRWNRDLPVLIAAAVTQAAAKPKRPKRAAP